MIKELGDGAFLVVVIIGLTEFAKRLGADGKISLVVSMLLGVALGFGYQFSLGPLDSFSKQFAALVYGLILALTASGLYDFAKKQISGAVIIGGNDDKK